MMFIEILKHYPYMALFLLSLPFQSFGQTVFLEEVEQEMWENAVDRKICKQIVDLNGDGIYDVVYSSSCGELTCIRVFLQINGKYVEQLNSGCSSYYLEKKSIELTEGSCCGESAFISHRIFEFDKTSAHLVENYIITSTNYTEGKRTYPRSDFHKSPYYVRVLNNNYNLRFSPDTAAIINEADVNFTCQPYTNIIAKLKIRSRLKVLAEDSDGDRTWLYVETGEETLADRCWITDFDEITWFNHQHPAIRGWVSGRYTEKE
jgi:hypothetical protein